MPSGFPRILITRLSAVGDCVHTMPLVGALRQQFPDAYIAWATQGGPASLLRDYPGLNQVIVVPRGYLKSWSTLRSVQRQLRDIRCDISIDPQSLTKSSVLGWLSGARQRIGFAPPQGRELSLWLNNQRIEPRTTHVVDRYLELLRPLVGDARLSPCFELPRYSAPAVTEFLDTRLNNRDFAVINPGAGWDSKLWLPERFAAVARQLWRLRQLTSVVVWAGDREHAWARSIVAAAPEATCLAPSTTLPELAELVRRARLCVAADTGPLHLAAAAGVPCVGLYGTTRPADCGPYGQIHASVQAFFQEGTARQRRRAENHAMRAISVPMVVNTCQRVLDATRQRQAA